MISASLHLIALDASDWGHYVVLFVFVVCALIFGVLFPAAIFLAAIFEKHHLRTLQPVRPDRRDAITASSRDMIALALAIDFAPIGTYTDGGKAIIEEIVSLFLSPDSSTLLWMQHRRPRRLRLISRLPGGTWVITSDTASTRDLSGVVDEIMLPRVSLPVLLREHLKRVAARGGLAVPFSAQTVHSDILDHEQVCAERAAERGFVRLGCPQGRSWRYTFRGACAVTAGFFTQMRNIKEARDAARLANEEVCGAQAAKPHVR